MPEEFYMYDLSCYVCLDLRTLHLNFGYVEFLPLPAPFLRS